MRRRPPPDHQDPRYIDWDTCSCWEDRPRPSSPSPAPAPLTWPQRLTVAATLYAIFLGPWTVWLLRTYVWR